MLLRAAAPAVAGPTWDGGGGADATWTNATNWDFNVAPDLANGTSSIVFSTLGSGTAAAATQLGGGLVDILSLRSSVLTGANVTVGAGATESGLSINSGTLVVRSGTITKANQAALVINSTLRLVSDGWFSSTNASNTGLIIAGPIIEDATSRSVVINASLGSVALGGASTYTGSTTVERGTLLVGLTANAAGAAVAPDAPGALGNSSSELLVGNANTLANNWNVGVTLVPNQSMSRTIRFANAGNGTATLTTNGTATLRSGTIILDRTINWNAGSANNAWTGLVTGTGGIAKGGGNTLELRNTANDFTGPVSLVNANLEVAISGTLNALGRGTSAIQILDTGNTSARQFIVNNSGTFSRGFTILATSANAVTVTTGNAGDVTFSGDMTLNSLGANVTLGAANQGTARYTGVLTGSAPVVRFSGATSNGNKVLLSNPANEFSGEIRVATAGLFVGGDAPAGAPGVLGNATSAILVGTETSGVNPSYLMIDGPYTVGRNILIPGPANGGSNGFTGEVGIGGGAAANAVFSGDLSINRTPGIGINYLMATSGGSVEFSGAVSGSAAIRVGGGSSTRTGFGSAHTRLGDVILSGNNAGFSGDVTVQTGVRLVLASNTALGSGTTAVGVGDGNAINSGTGGISTRGAVTVTRSFVSNRTITNNNRPISFEGTTADPAVFSGSISVTGTNTAQPIVFAAVAGGSVDFQGAITATSSFPITTSITKAGAGLVIFSGTNNYNGTTFVSDGMLSIGSTNSLPGWNVSRRLNVASGAALVVGDAVTEADFSTILASGTFSANAAIGFNVGPGGRLPLTTSIGNPTANPLGFVKIGSGTLTMNAANTYTGTTTVSAGVLRLANDLALQNSVLDTSGTGSIELAVTAPTFGGLSGGTDLATEFSGGFGSLTGLTLSLGSGATQTYTGVVSDGAAGMAITKAGQGTQILGGANTYTGLTTVSAGTLQLGVGSSLPGDIANAGSLVLLQGGSTAGVVGGVISGTGTLDVAGGGTVTLVNAASTYTGQTTIQSGITEVAVLADAGLASSLGAPTSAAATIIIGSGTLRYIGTGHSTDRPIYLAVGGGVLDASGSGPVAFTGGVTGVAGTTLTLTGSNTGANSIAAITGSNVVKTGPGTWVFGQNSFTGRLSIEQGTIVAAINAPGGSGTSSSLGRQNGPIPVIGVANATGTAALLAASGVTISRVIEVAGLGSGDQEVVLGSSGAGTATFDGNSAFRLGRGVTLAADPAGNVRFLTPTANWEQQNGSENPAVAVTIGTPTATGTVTLETRLPTSITQVTVRQGTLRLAVSSTFGSATPVTVGSAAAPATLDLAGLGQTMQSLSFGGTSGLVVPGGGSGVLRLGGASPTVMAASGAGHRIDSAVALDEAATFTVAGAEARMTVAGGIADGTNGPRGLTKLGSGTLAITGNSSYTGATAVDAGTLELDGVLGDTALTVAVGATLTGTGTIGGPTTILGTHSPGSSPGIETFTNGLTYGASATLVWELIANSESQRGILFDGVDLTGGALSVASGATLSLVFNLPGSTVDWDDPFWDDDRTWTVIDVAGGSWNSSLFTSITETADANGFSLTAKRAGSSFLVMQLSGDLVLKYVVVPEPGSFAIGAIGFATAAWVARRRAQRRRG